MKKTPNAWMVLFVAAFLALIGWAAWAFFSRYSTLTSDNLDLFIREFGPWAVAVYGLAYLLSSPIPFMAPVLAATGGLLFGPVIGTLLAILIAAATSLVPFTMSRKLGREWVEAKLRGTRVEGFYRRAYQNNGFRFVLLLRLVPVMPWELQNYVAGVTPVSLPSYLAATILGSAPLSIALVILGTTFKNPGSWQFFAALALTGVILLAPIAYVSLSGRISKKTDSNEK
jgi:uncharacterized membrane protein YdjX (TVP38/TMEM64 family)